MHMDVTASPSEILVYPVQDRIPTGSWTWCISCSLVGLTDPLTPQLPHFLTDFLDETHPDICVPDSPSVPRTRTGGDGQV